MFGETKIKDFVKLIRWPALSQNSPRLFSMQRIWSIPTSAKRCISSAKNKYETLGPLLNILTTFYTPEPTWCWIYWLSLSIRNKKTSGDKGSPWWSPLLGLIYSVNSPFHNSWHQLEDNILMIISVSFPATTLSRWASARWTPSSSDHTFSLGRASMPYLLFLLVYVSGNESPLNTQLYCQQSDDLLQMMPSSQKWRLSQFPWVCSRPSWSPI